MRGICTVCIFPDVLENERCVLKCGNSLYDSGEACDDGNYLNGDGCSSTCQLEPDSDCTFNDDPNPDICDVCGNSKRKGPETCDDGN